MSSPTNDKQSVYLCLSETCDVGACFNRTPSWNEIWVPVTSDGVSSLASLKKTSDFSLNTTSLQSLVTTISFSEVF